MIFSSAVKTGPILSSCHFMGLKIDVDGAEGKIIKGTEKAISDERPKSLLEELDTHYAEYNRYVQYLENAGINLKAKSLATSFGTRI